MIYAKKILYIALATLAFVAPGARLAAEDGAAPDRAGFLAPRTFSWKALAEPENLFWPGYFWGYGGRWNAAEFRRQLEDMVAHDARSVCVIPNGCDCRPGSNPKDCYYLSPAFFERVKFAVDQAARLGMNYWFYDEPGFPSGQAGGQVVCYRPEAVGHLLAYDGHGKWTERNGPRVDYLDPKATDTFIAITHERYAKAVGSHFGKTIKLVFTDEPSFIRVHPGSQLPWTAGAADVFRDWFGYSIMDKLDAFHTVNTSELSPAQKNVRVDLYDFWTRRFRDAYFRPLARLVAATRPGLRRPPRRRRHDVRRHNRGAGARAAAAAEHGRAGLSTLSSGNCSPANRTTISPSTRPRPRIRTARPWC